MVVVRVLGAVPSSVTESETTTFRISLLRRPISRRRSATSGLAITVMDTSEVSATAGQYPLSPVYVVAPSSSVSALRRRSRFCSSEPQRVGAPHALEVLLVEEAYRSAGP
jgi:hypothetical protein